MRAPLLAATLALAGCLRPLALPPLPPPMVALPPPPPASPGSLWRAERADNYLFVDVRAHFPGDLLTVIVSETAKGNSNGKTDASADSSIAASVQEFFGVPASLVKFLPGGFNPEQVVEAQTKRSSKGDAETTRQGSLAASITVRVVDVEPNGNLRIQGDKEVSVNGEHEHIVLLGIVRPEDIAPDNSVPSTRLADARIQYYGRGTVGDKQGVPLVHRAFDWIWPF
jgi:flagellar L-ring protein precursor FlgH